MKTVKLKREDLLKAFNKADEKGKELLKELYPDEFGLCKTWEEYCINGQHDKFSVIFPIKYWAAYKLEQLRNHYNGSCEQNHESHIYNNKISGYGVYTEMDEIRFLNFKSTELAEQFLTNFKELIIEAGDLV